MQLSGRALARNLAKLCAGLFLFAVMSVGSGTPASAQISIGVGTPGGGTTIGTDREHRSRDEGRHDRREHGSGPRIGIEVDVRQIRPAYCYTHSFGGVVTCRKRSLNGETCEGDCILYGGNTAVGPAPPAHAKAPGVSYHCNCGD
jgi:hypothetical protein